MNEDEKKYAELNAKFHKELADLERQMEDLDKRHKVLHELLFGDPVVDLAEEKPLEERIDDHKRSGEKDERDRFDAALVSFLRRNPGSNRREIVDGLREWGQDVPYMVEKSIKRLRSRELVVREGTTRNAVWSAAEES